MTKSLCACVLLAAATACASHTPPPQAAGADATGTTQTATARNRDFISHEELQAPNVVSLTVLEAVRSLRPRFLINRGTNTVPAVDPKVVAGPLGYDPNPLNDGEAGRVHCSIDGNKVGPLDELDRIRAISVKEIRYLDVAAAHQKFGSSSHEGPVILVTTM
jgi:hypothetical protein